MVRGALVVAGLLVAALAFADGKFFSRSVKAPDMPRQRAVLVWKDGTETLIVESVVSTDGGQELAWVLPVRGEPRDVGFATPGTVATLPAVLNPEIMSGAQTGATILGLLALCLFVYVAATVGVRKVSPRLFFFESIAILAICTVVVAIVFPTFASARGGAQVSPWTQTGGMEAAVVRGEGAAVGRWLEENGFPVQPAESRAIADYASDAWSFVVCRAQSVEGDAAPLPLRVSFPTDRAVYPMKLTGVGLGSVHVDLTVVAESPVRARGLEAYETVLWDAEAPRTSHTEVARLVWDGAVVTRLVGTLSGSRLQEDVWIEERGEIGRKTLAMEGEIAWTASVWTFGMLVVSMIAFGCVAIARGWSKSKFALFGIIGPLVVGTLGGLVLSFVVPTVETEAKFWGGRGFHFAEHTVQRLVDGTIEIEAARQEMEENGAGHLFDRDVPGGFVIEDGQVVWYDARGNPSVFETPTQDD